jgi:hypothetical protein
MPRSTCACTWRSAAISTSFAVCISASSAGDLISRHARTSGSPATISRPLDARRTPSTMNQRVVASTASGPLGGAAVAQRLRDQRVRALVLVPRPDVAAGRERLAHRRLLERGRDDDRFAVGGNDRRGGALGAPPADAAEILERRAGFDEQRADLRLAQQPLQLRDPRAAAPRP